VALAQGSPDGGEPGTVVVVVVVLVEVLGGDKQSMATCSEFWSVSNSELPMIWSTSQMVATVAASCGVEPGSR
jgi:hypothetical protein